MMAMDARLLLLRQAVFRRLHVRLAEFVALDQAGEDAELLLSRIMVMEARDGFDSGAEVARLPDDVQRKWTEVVERLEEQ